MLMMTIVVMMSMNLNRANRHIKQDEIQRTRMQIHDK